MNGRRRGGGGRATFSASPSEIVLSLASLLALERARQYIVIVELVVDHAPAAGATAGVDAAMTRVRAEAACGLHTQ